MPTTRMQTRRGFACEWLMCCVMILLEHRYERSCNDSAVGSFQPAGPPLAGGALVGAMARPLEERERRRTGRRRRGLQDVGRTL